MMTTNMISAAVNNDAELVQATLGGNRDAFGQIVSRYQSLICSLAYSATGSLGQSEDLAQETFITAWRHLGRLRERDKLRAWLCGIARNRINNFLRREGREPIREAEPLENVPESRAAEPLPVEQTITNEEAAILWRSLERIPQIYREPLVLFYREHRSIEAVAEELEMSGEAVKQRLSRGRKMLQEEVIAFVEGALERTNPGKNFTLNVLAALPALSVSSKAAIIGTAAVKGGAAAKGAGMMGLLGAIFSPVLVFFGNYASYRMSMDEAHSDEERRHVKTVFLKSLVITLGLSLVLSVPLYWACRSQTDAYLFWGLLASQTIVLYFLTLGAIALSSLPARRRYLARILADDYAGDFPPSAYEYRSRLSLFGLPLIHVRIGDRFDMIRGPVKAWIAVGSSHAVGVIFASGGIAIAPISFGGVAIGLLSFGGVSLGVFSIGAISLGLLAYGGLAFGWQAFGGFGAAWNAVRGNLAIAHDFAVGDIVMAMQANTEAAKQFIQQNLFFRISQMLANHSFLVMLLWIIPVTLQARVVARARRRREQVNS
jgi:RNA polymerase sigma factor (sigma-70 family)